MEEDQWLTAEEVADRLGLTARQVNRYGTPTATKPARLRTERAGRRVLYHREDVEQLAQELQPRLRPKVSHAKTDLVPAGEMLEYIRDRDRQLAEIQERLQSQLNQALLEIGRLQGQLAETQHIRGQLEAVQAERDELQEAIEQARPWWKRLLGR